METGKKTPRLTLPPEEALPRIDAITVNARATWFALLGLLAFVGVTLLGVEDIDFFDASRRTDLPLVGVSVPTLTFFYVAPALTAAVYAYFHFYLMKLWDALAEAPATVKGRRLGDLVHPWLVTDAALWFRRHEGATADRPLRIVSSLTAGALSWGFGWAVLGYAWWRSHTAHLEWMSLWLLALFVFSLWVGITGLRYVLHRVGNGSRTPMQKDLLLRGTRTLLVLSLGWLTWTRTEGGDIDMLASIDLRDARIVEKPVDWLEHDAAETDFRAEWCRRRERPVSACMAPQEAKEGGLDKDAMTAQQAARDKWCLESKVASDSCEAFFEREEARLVADWGERRGEYRSTLTRLSMKGRDLRGADLTNAFLPGLDLRMARLEGAALTGVSMEGANLSDAKMSGATLIAARLQGANLSRAYLIGTSLSGARMGGSNLTGAQMMRAFLNYARLEGASLNGAGLSGADLSRAQLEGAELRRAQMNRANLSLARMGGVDLSGASLEGADLREARMQGALLKSTTLSLARFARSNLRAANLTGVQDITQDQVDSMFGDRATILPDHVRRTDLMDREPLRNRLDPDPDYEAWLAAGAPPGKPLP